MTRNRVTKSADQLLEHAQEQMGFLIASAAAYDAGSAAEAKRLAVSLRVLLRATANSHALLEQTGHLDRLWVLDTAGGIDPQNMMPSNLLTAMYNQWGASTPLGELPYVFVPHFSEYTRSVGPTLSRQIAGHLTGDHPVRPRGQSRRFEDWWTADVIKDQAGTSFSRQRLVLALANEEGGAHVDPRTKADYHALANSNSLGWHLVTSEDPANPGIPFGSPIPASVRQIAWEVHETIFNQTPELLPAGQRTRPPRRWPVE